MSTQDSTRKSLWEHVGYPGIPPRNQPQTTEDVDRVFKGHLTQMHEGRAPTLERVESVLAWSTLRDEEFRSTLSYFYDYGILNQPTNREAGPAELLEYQEQVDAIRADAATEALGRLADGGSERSAKRLEERIFNRRHNEETRVRRPALPSVEETWEPRRPVLKSLGWGALWTLLTVALGGFAYLVDVPGLVPEFLAGKPWVSLVAAVVSVAVVFYVAHGWYVYKPSSQNKWLYGDKRGRWPLLVWALVSVSVGVAFPLWVLALWVPVSAGVPLLIPRFRERLIESVGAVEGPMLELRELRGSPGKFRANVFVPANSTIQAEAAALPYSLPVRSRDGSGAYSVDASQEALLSLAEHSSVEPSGLANDVHKVVGAVLLDVVVGATGVDDLRLIGQYGSGPMRLVARAVTLGLGQDVLPVPGELDGRPGRAVADWREGEADAYREFTSKLLSEDDARLALRVAVTELDAAVDYDFPHQVRYRLETLRHALICAAASA